MDSAPTSYHEAHEGGSRRDSGDGSFITLMRTEGQGLQDNISAQDDDIKELRVPDVSGIPPRLHEPSIYRRLWRFTKGCWVELVACVLALASLLAIMATTYAHQDLPFPKWSYGLSINTLVAIYIAVMKAALVLVASQGLGQLKWSWFRDPRPLSHLEVYDEASRGVWGSLALMWTLRLRSLGPCLAAMVMILSTILDPFGQQIVHFYPCSIVDPDQIASVSTSHNADVGYFQLRGSNANGVQGGAHATRFEVISAIHQGLFNPAGPKTDFICPTGNCTFPATYHSTGFYSQCEDISNQMKVYDNETGEFLFYANETEKWINDGFYMNFPVLNFTVESSNDEFWLQTPAAHFALHWNQYSDSEAGTKQGLFAMFANSEKDANRQECLDSGSTWLCQDYGAAICNLGPAVVSYNGEVKGGDFTEVVVGMQPFDQFEFETRTGILLDISCLNADERHILQHRDNRTIPDNSETDWLGYECVEVNFYESDRTGNSTAPGIRSECIYRFDNIVGRTFQWFLWELLLDIKLMRHDKGILHNVEDPIAVAFYRKHILSLETVQETMSDIANAITISLRNLETEPYHHPHVGQAFSNETCVRVRWPWLTYPAALTLMILVFMFQLFREQVLSPQWQDDPIIQHNYKTALVPLLLHSGLNTESIKDEGGRQQQHQQQQQRAKQLDGYESTCTVNVEGQESFNGLIADGVKRRHGKRGNDMFIRFESGGRSWKLVEVDNDAHREEKDGKDAQRDA